jgi:hypothetical protein
MTRGTTAPEFFTSGRISPAAAAKTTPAAKCCTALRIIGVGGRQAVKTAPTTAANMGKAVITRLFIFVLVCAWFPRCGAYDQAFTGQQCLLLYRLAFERKQSASVINVADTNLSADGTYLYPDCITDPMLSDISAILHHERQFNHS